MRYFVRNFCLIFFFFFFGTLHYTIYTITPDIAILVYFCIRFVIDLKDPNRCIRYFSIIIQIFDVRFNENGMMHLMIILACFLF